MENLAASLFGLIKTNGGLYKSEKQGAFLLSKAFDGVIVHTQDYHFGEYEGRTNRNTAKVTFEFILGAEGISAVYKTTKTNGRSLYWKFDAAKVEEVRIQAVKRKEEKEQQRLKEDAEKAELLAKYTAELKDLEECQAECIEFLKSKGEGTSGQPEVKRVIRALACFMGDADKLKKLINNLSN